MTAKCDAVAGTLLNWVERISVGSAMQDRHRKIRRQLYGMIPFLIVWLFVVLSMVYLFSEIEGLPVFVMALMLVIFILFPLIFLLRRIRHIILDLRPFESRITIPQAVAIAILGMWNAIIIVESFFISESIYQRSIDTVDFLKNIFRYWVMRVINP